jgi:hypothetical protein
MNQKRLLRSLQAFEYTPQAIQESKRLNNGKVFLEGIVQKADTLNQNGRIYPRDILQREVNNYQKLIIENRASGECDHPDSSVISLANVSHMFTKLWMEGNIVYGRIQICNTPSGKIIQALLDDGLKIGISSRGVGSTERQGDYHVVQDDFQIICWDLVSEPSTPGAFMLPEEGSAYMPEGKLITIDESLSHNTDTIIKETNTNYLDSLITDILSSKGRK